VADWEVDNPRLRNNLLEVLRDARDRAVRLDVPTVEDARSWQRDTMAGLDVPDTEYVGRFRGEPGLARYPAGQELDGDGLAAVIDLVTVQGAYAFGRSEPTR
jgi:hypothetical protein